MIAEKPNAVFQWLWFAWCMLLGACQVVDNNWLRIALAVSFFAIEMPGAVTEGRAGDRRTLSRIVTYFHHKMTKAEERRVALRGWNALLFTPFVLLICNTFYAGIAGPVYEPLAFGMTIVLGIGLWDHWYQTAKYG